MVDRPSVTTYNQVKLAYRYLPWYILRPKEAARWLRVRDVEVVAPGAPLTCTARRRARPSQAYKDAPGAG